MAKSIDLVVGTNTLGTFQESEDYFQTSLFFDQWCSFSTTKKKRAMVTAFMAMKNMSWDGEKTDSAQLAPFPRTGLVDGEGDALDSAEIPEIAKFGQFELALYLGINTGFESSAKGQIKEVQAGTVKVKYYETTPGTDKGAVFPQEILQYFNVLASSSFEVTPGFASGVDQESFFASTNYDTV
ncbi:MAG: hypothetical protein COB09_18605 [Thalassobium sp.]|nr:MAG: hypothetical protein COB09_18605 [Thalassobium sp.]